MQEIKVTAEEVAKISQFADSECQVGDFKLKPNISKLIKQKDFYKLRRQKMISVLFHSNILFWRLKMPLNQNQIEIPFYVIFVKTFPKWL